MTKNNDDKDKDAGYKEMLKTVNEFTSTIESFPTLEQRQPQGRYDLSSISQEQASMLCEKIAKCSAQLQSVIGRNQAEVYRMMAAVRSASEAAIDKDPTIQENRISRWQRICRIENDAEKQKPSRPHPQKRRLVR